MRVFRSDQVDELSALTPATGEGWCANARLLHERDIGSSCQVAVNKCVEHHASERSYSTAAISSSGRDAHTSPYGHVFSFRVVPGSSANRKLRSSVD